MKSLRVLAIASVRLFAIGCSDEQQLRNAESDLRKQEVETAETINKAKADGVVTSEEKAEIREKEGDEAEAAGDVAENAGDVIEDRTDK